MQNSSDRNGRALEYAVVVQLEQRLSPKKARLTTRAVQSQLKDEQKYLSLSVYQQQQFQAWANLVYDWLEAKFLISSQDLTIDRLADTDARAGDPTDVRLESSLQKINLSIKHNHKALKHQRPASTAQHCGYSIKTPEDLQFREQYQAVIKAFNVFTSGYSYFRDLETGIVSAHLYQPICELVARSINLFCCYPEKANHLFRFLVSDTNFYKLILDLREQELRIQPFHKPEFVDAVIAKNFRNYVHLDFSNAWRISMRLHTASSRITINPNLKFDTQLDDQTSIVEERLRIQ
ncbi:HaeIII family restriction endonuclease [Phormidium tenue FACHB-886]|nr:HaeIII family restriction endonuclease [Phormidium tenue FACHB-886]